MIDIAAHRRVDLVQQLNADELELAVRHGLIGLMADCDDPNLSIPSTPLFARLSARHSVMRRHLNRILTELHAEGIHASVLKGLHLAEWAYCNPAHRTTTDIDLLVPGDQVERALDLLLEDEAVQMIPVKTPKADKRNIPLYDPSGVRFTLDLHWDLFSYTQLRGCADGATDWAWSHATLNEDHVLGPMWELPDEARIAFLCTHALLDHRFRLILFRDLAEVAAMKPDWEALIRFSERWKLRSTSYLALLIAVGLLDAVVPREVLEKLRTNSIPVSYLEATLPHLDLVQFDENQPRGTNLAFVVLADRARTRSGNYIRAPHASLKRWKSREH